jgi:hypothetical protein
MESLINSKFGQIAPFIIQTKNQVYFNLEITQIE